MKYGDATWDLEQSRTRNHANEIHVDDNHGNSPGARITASTRTNWSDPSHAAAAGQLRRGASSVSA